MISESERIGIILVHGIGEQRRFEHLQAQLRPLIAAIERRPNTEVTTDIVEGQSAALHAEQETWASHPDASVRLVVRQGTTTKELFIHEVWWADANEPYSLMKQVRFWLWGLSVWLYPRKTASTQPGAVVMTSPAFPDANPAAMELKVRLKLFGAGSFFLMGAFSVGAIVFLAKRLLNFSAPDLIRVLVNYVAGVKLYNQRRRAGGGFLDAINEPPRISIRRRMIRTMADVRLAPYDRWYVLAHSLGSLVAYNGLMENAQALANYLNEGRWQSLVANGLAGPGAPPNIVGVTAGMVPTRPVWLQPNDVVYRDKLLANFAGLLTYGSPLDKFAAIWPARVPINTGEPVFPANAEWINVFDPTDPVSGSLDAFNPAPPAPLVLTPFNIGYRAHWLLLFSHSCYLRATPGGTDQLCDRVAEWLLAHTPFNRTIRPQYFRPGSWTEIARNASAWLMWIVAFLLLAMLGACALKLLGPILLQLMQAAWAYIVAACSTIFRS